MTSARTGSRACRAPEQIYQLVAPDLPSDFPPLTTLDRPRTNLPAQTTAFIGREREVTRVGQLLRREDVRLVTLIGPGGTGKTRLSRQVAADALDMFEHGVWFVNLAPISDPNLVASTIAQALDVREIGGQPIHDRLKDYLREKQTLLLLDNFEQVVDAAPLVGELLATAPGLKVLVTSRMPLRLSGEHEIAVPPLGLPPHPPTPAPTPGRGEAGYAGDLSQYEAVRLFIERAHAVKADFAITNENAPAVAEICYRLDGLPLAIELAAARIKLFSPQALLMRLENRLKFLTGGARDLPARQQTIRNTIDWSYDLLDEGEKKLFARLGVFVGGWMLEAAEAVCNADGDLSMDVVDGIAALVDKSLLRPVEEKDGEPRFTMLETIREYALDRLHRMGEEAQVRSWHLTYFLDLAEQADKEIHGPDQVEWNDRLSMELDNFRAALGWCVSNQYAELALRLLGALSWSWWVVQDQNSEIRSWFDKIRTLPAVTDYPALYARLLNRIGGQSWLSGDFREARSVLKQSQAIWLKLGVDGERGLAEALDYLGLVARTSEGANKTAQSFFEQSLELYQKHGDQRGMAFALLNLAYGAGERNDDASTLSLFEQSLDLFGHLGDLWGIGRASQGLGYYFLKQGIYEKARFYVSQHLRIDEGLDFKQGTMVALENMGTLYRLEGNYAQAEQFYEKSLALCREHGLNDWGFGLYSLGMVALQRNNYSFAKQCFIDYFGLAWKIWPGEISASDLLTGLAAVAGGANQPEHAAKLSGAAQAIFETTDYRFPPFDRAEFDRHIQIARDQLGETRFEALAAEGRAMTMEQAITYALENQSE